MRSTAFLPGLSAIFLLTSCAHSTRSDPPVFQAPLPAQCQVECSPPPPASPTPRKAVVDLYESAYHCARLHRECVTALMAGSENRRVLQPSDSAETEDKPTESNP